MRKTTLCITMLLLLLLISCNRDIVSISDLNMDSEALKYEIAVDGFISTENTNCKISIYRPLFVNDSITRIAITNAVVLLREGDNTYPFDFTKEDRWHGYRSCNKIKGIVGRTYTLEITYNGKVYTASDVMPEANDDFKFPIESVITESKDWIFPTSPGFMEIWCTKHNFGFEEYMIYRFRCKKWTAPGEDWTNLEESGSMNLYNHRGSIAQGIFPVAWNHITNLSGIKTDSVEITKRAISEEYYTYLISKFNETDWRSGLFSTVPGNVKTNVSEGGTGFFYATNVRRKLVTMEELANTKR